MGPLMRVRRLLIRKRVEGERLEVPEIDVARLEEEFSDLPVKIEIEEGNRLVLRLPVFLDKRTFDEFVKRCKRLRLRFDRERKVWYTYL